MTMDLADLFASLGPAGAVAAVMYLWLLDKERLRKAADDERKTMTANTIGALEKVARLGEATRDNLAQIRESHRDDMRRLCDAIDRARVDAGVAPIDRPSDKEPR